jgi:hypothetical protein
METALLILAIIGSVLLGFLVAALWYRARKGRFRVLRRDPRCFTFRSDFGTFTIDAAGKSLIRVAEKDISKIPLSDIQRLHYRYHEEEAPIAELVRGWDIWDFTRKYRDVTGWFEISAVLSDGKQLPLYAIGQFEPRELWSGWWYDLQRRLLAKVGLFQSAEDDSRAVVHELQAAFAAAGRRLSLT